MPLLGAYLVRFGPADALPESPTSPDAVLVPTLTYPSAPTTRRNHDEEAPGRAVQHPGHHPVRSRLRRRRLRRVDQRRVDRRGRGHRGRGHGRRENVRASSKGKSVTGRVDLGGLGILKKKNKTKQY